MWKAFRATAFISSSIFVSPVFQWNQKTGKVSYPANLPIEDRLVSKKLQGIPARIAAVFDGHGGWQISDFLSQNIISTVSRKLDSSSVRQKDKIQQVLEQSFDELEEHIYHTAQDTYKLGFSNISTTGSCALVSIITDSFYVFANSGDCQAVLVQEDNGQVIGKNICPIHSSNLKEEQERLATQFPGEKDIVVCKHSKACYVKGRLMPSRSFGDLYLKHEEFNNPVGLTSLHGFRKPRIRDFTGPYITHKPDVVILDKSPKDKYIILATDGLWDEMDEQTAAQIVMQAEDADEASKLLLEFALKNAAQDRKMFLNDLKSVPQGKRRNIHDDITIVVIPVS